ncbi:C-5 cytosine-specific DNA methylase [Mesorhizobium sp. Root157]|uniref:DNA cytosine methyltransferase n=1 Tax=Mesorhizobium sp. Root157 TaxID=1736477 RepID=UPI0006FEFAAB|nr:DNA cytosine methyltransferase [Mesorhizobium sp. Root157]KQZ82042.1 C-5 cytosine-specific DNA methylase [Mesorhizobium sp. Root157]
MIIDSFAGGGGASTGIEMALGRSPDIAINHNPAALALHAANHPDTLHVSENVYHVDPLDYLAGRHVGLAWFSPDCKHFSKAKGGKPVERNIRDLAWIIPGWIERIQKSGGRVDVVILENVEEFRTWGPLVETDRGLMPDPETRGHTFEKWCKQLRRLGFKVEWRELRACDFGAPTIRKRLFLIARSDGQKIVWPKPTHAPSSVSEDGIVTAWAKGHGLTLKDLQGISPYRTAAEIIDWSQVCPSIFDTSDEIMTKHGLRAVRPLASATMSRVARGVKRYVLDAKRPFLVDVAHGEVSPSGVKRWGKGFRSVDDPLSVVTAGGINHAVVAPSVIRFNTGATGHDAREPLATVTANSFKKRPGGAAPLGIVAPVLSYAQQGGANRSVEDPVHTITASKKDQNAVIAPTLIQMGYGEREGQAPRVLDVEAPLGTVVAGGIKHAIAVSTLVGCGGRAGQSRPRGGNEPTATITSKADVCVAAAFLAQHNNDGRRDGGVNPGRPADEPLSTITGTPQQGVIAAFVSRQFGTSTGHGLDEPTHTATADVNKSMLIAPHLMTMRNAGKPFNGADEPTHTITAGGAGLSLVAPFMQKYYGTGDGARLDEPAHTVTVKDRFGYVEGELQPELLTEAQITRAHQVADFMRAHGFWDEREFVEVEIDGVTFIVVDIGMRMLTPRELFSAQGFPPGYIIDLDFEGKPLPKSVQISCCGNSVSPPMAAALVAANCGYLARFREAAE